MHLSSSQRECQHKYNEKKNYRLEVEMERGSRDDLSTERTQLRREDVGAKISELASDSFDSISIYLWRG